MRIDRLAGQLGCSAGRKRAGNGSVIGVLHMPGAPFSLATNAERDGHKRRLAASFNAVASENVEVHTRSAKHDATLPPASHGGASSCRNKASNHAD